MHRGYVRDYRKGIDNPLFKRPNIWHFWTYCRLRANHKETIIDFNGVPLTLKRGCFLISLKGASDATGLTVQNIRTAIKILESHKMIEKSTSQVTKQATIINVINYGTYQQEKKPANKATNTELTQCQQSANKVLTTDNNVKNVKKDKNKVIYNPLADKQKFLENIPDSIKSKYPNTNYESITDDIIDYCQRSGKTYKDYYAAMRTFIKNDQKRNPQQNKKHGNYTDDFWEEQLNGGNQAQPLITNQQPQRKTD